MLLICGFFIFVYIFNNLKNPSFPLHVNGTIQGTYLTTGYGGISSSYVQLSGTTPVKIVSETRGSFMIYVLGDGNDMPSAVFSASDDSWSMAGGVSTVSSASGYSGGNLVLSWPGGDGIYLSKDSTNYDGNYKVMIVGIGG